MRLRRRRIGRSTALAGSLALVIAGASATAGSPGDLDPTFDGDGKVTTHFGGLGSLASDLVVQPDGKIVAAGFAVFSTVSRPDFENFETQFALARYNPDGSLDTSFGDDGKVTTDFPGDFEKAEAVALQEDGHIVVAGSAFTSPLFSDFALARYLPDGTLDTTFDDDGKVTTDFAGHGDEAFDLAILEDGKLVVAGYHIVPAPFDFNFALARYHTDGTLDVTFDGDGKVSTDFAGERDEAYAVAIQADGRIVAAGDAQVGRDIDFALARYSVDGRLDSTFDGDGKVTTPFNTHIGQRTGDFANGVAIQSDGRIVASGTALRTVEFGGINTGDFDFALARYRSDGALDTDLEHDGTVTTDLGSYVDFPTGLAIQNDQRIVVAGFTTVTGTGTYDFALVRYDTEGFLDRTFGGGAGVITTDFNRRDDGAYSAAIQRDGKIVAAGVGGGHFGLARYSVCRRSSMISSILCPHTHATSAANDESKLSSEIPRRFEMLKITGWSPVQFIERTAALVRGSAS